MEAIETLGKYEIKGPLGRGAMGTVYEGWDPIIARRVAIKTVRLPDAAEPETAEALERFRREAQAAGRLNHPNIVGVFDYGETKDLAYIVMEFVDGPPLKSLLDGQERFTLADTVRIMEDLLTGLQFSHQRGVVHRDIKPANVMLTSTGQAKIADFGIARIESSSMTQAGTILGTPAYMSPEQFMGQVVDARTDIYSSGVVLYQLLTGERPFEGGMSAIMHKALNTEPPAPSQISVTTPPSFDAVVRRAMAKRPEDRYSSATAFAEAIRVAMSGQGTSTSGDEPTVVAAPERPQPRAATSPAPGPDSIPPTRPAARSSAAAAVAVVMLVLLASLGGGGWWLLSRAPAETAQKIATTVTPPVIGSDAPPTATQEAASVTNPSVAFAGADVMRQQIAQYVASRDCALLAGEVLVGGSVALAGLAGNSVADSLRQGVVGIALPNDVDWRVTGIDPVFCPALNALRPATPVFGAEGVRLGLRMADGRSQLRDGDKVRVALTMPDFPSEVRVDYISHDGTVQHLYPQIADARQGIMADQPRVYGAGEPVALGHPAWEIAEPYGTDLIIAVASSQPLLPHARPGNAEPGGVYLRELQAAIDDAQRRGINLAGAAVTLQALPK